MNPKHVYTVSQVNSYIHRIFESDYALKKMYLKGEVSNCKYHSSGHIYFTLKDEKSAIRCVMFSSDRYRGLKFRLENGQSVIVGGNISVFERDGSYQLYAREIDLSGTGALYLRYEQLKRELAEEGYFDFDIKKPLPMYPKRIGIVTAATGAAIQDIRSVARRRNPYVQLYLYPAKVQGEGAAQDIVAGIRYFDRQGLDIIIIGRGGGSIEDLWAFNERIVADAIYEARTPIISGTGHEVDITIADYCADVRAATPSAACEIAIPDIYAVLQQLDHYQEEMNHGILTKINRVREQLYQYQRILEGYKPEKKLLEQKLRYHTLEQALHQRMTDLLRDYKYRYQIYCERLHALSPTSRLSGGYVYARNPEGKPITTVKQLEPEKPFELILRDGSATVQPTEIHDMIDIEPEQNSSLTQDEIKL